MTDVRTQWNKQILQEHQTHHLCTLWIITREDGVGGHNSLGQYFYTDHNQAITYEYDPIPFSATFLPAGAFRASARDQQSGLQSSNFEAIGVLDAEEITFEDLRVGRFNNAKIEEILINWRFPFLGQIQRRVYWITDLQHTQDIWQAQIAGPTALLNANMGEVYNRLCRYTVGDVRCGVNLFAFKYEGSVLLAHPLKLRFQFEPSWTTPPAEDELVRFGLLTWLTGDNVGFLSEVAELREGSIGKELVLRLDTPFDIENGDTFSITAGCDKTVSTCHTRFNNIPNHGGFPTIPGNDAMLNTPDAVTS